MSSRARPILAFVCAALLPLAACSDDAPTAAPTQPSPSDTDDAASAQADPIDPLVELGVVWRRIIGEPAAAAPADVELANALIQAHVLPAVENAQWQVESVVGAPTSDFHAELFSGTRKLLTLELRHRGDVPAAERNAYGDQFLQGHPCSRRSRFLFVLAGNVELRATGEDPAFRSYDSLEPILTRFPLEQLAKL